MEASGKSEGGKAFALIEGPQAETIQLLRSSFEKLGKSSAVVFFR
jgi:hypothetical protein